MHPMILGTNQHDCFTVIRKLAVKYSDEEFQIIFLFIAYLNQVRQYRLESLWFSTMLLCLVILVCILTSENYSRSKNV